MEQISVGGRELFARSFTDRAKLIYAKRAASNRVNSGVHQRACNAREFVTAAPFVLNAGDKGLARPQSAGAILGTVHYMAFEQARGEVVETSPFLYAR